MRFISDIGRPWTIRGIELAIRLHKQGYSISYIADLLHRSVREIRVVLA